MHRAAGDVVRLHHNLQEVHVKPGFDKDEGLLGTVVVHGDAKYFFQQHNEGGNLFVVTNHKGTLFKFLTQFHFCIQANDNRVVKAGTSELRQNARHRGREEGSLTGLWQLLHDGDNLRLQAQLK
ncbi:hypothetical protein DQ04_07901000 [Trypanosoma grayi]|uniref:hypothetical protein n=1 Tax=Trypanosoma grayi TaxID=71804 RepID=UPI0004F4269B|nr:hypothetical protein DQ04_07901000 [Trypanosoma grayi]KEG08143.1 hypothetical protein DQ04_07901000 [Trypanosoma grayi]